MKSQEGKRVSDKELMEMFDAQEGGVQAIYGPIRSGKSTEGVRRMYQSLSNGKVVYSNILLDFSGVEFDDRQVPFYVFTSAFSWRKRFYVFDKKNYHYFNPLTGEVDGVKTFDPLDPNGIIVWLNTLTDCEIYFDEGQRILNSYEATHVSPEKLALIEETGHVNRLIVIITQRTQRIHVNARGNVNQFFRCSKKMSFFPFLIFPILKYYVTEYQEMIGNEVDETMPCGRMTYTVKSNRKVWSMFNTHYLRGGRKKSQKVFFKAYDLTRRERFLQLIYFLKCVVDERFGNILSHFRR